MSALRGDDSTSTPPIAAPIAAVEPQLRAARQGIKPLIRPSTSSFAHAAGMNAMYMDAMPTAGWTPTTRSAGRITTPPIPTAPMSRAPMPHARMTRTSSPGPMSDTKVSDDIVANPPPSPRRDEVKKPRAELDRKDASGFKIRGALASARDDRSGFSPRRLELGTQGDTGRTRAVASVASHPAANPTSPR